MYNLSDEVTRKFVDTISASDWEIETESGWVDIFHINKTIQYEKWILETESGLRIECADNHILFLVSGQEVFVKDLAKGDVVRGQFGGEVVSCVTKTSEKEHMYDLSVSGNHTYYAEGLLHHNTTVAAAYICWYLIFNKEKTVAILANKQATAYEIMDRLRLMYESLPKFIQRGVITWNRGSFSLDNLSRVFASATSKTAIRGRSPQFVYCDEYAFIETSQAEEFFTAVYPALSAGKESKMVISSTPNGFNFFEKLWKEAEKGINGFVPILCMWNEHPDRDQKWLDEQVAALGELKSNQEIFCTFLGSSKQLLSAAALSRLSYDTPIKEYLDQYRGLKIYTAPIKGHSYVTTVDVSRGRHLDASAFWVVDVTQQPYTIAATYNNNEISPMMYATLLHRVCTNYNDSYTLIEINDVGAQVADIMYSELEYDSMFWTKSGDQVGRKGADPYPGIRTTKKTKRIGCANLKDLVEKNNLIINDFQTIQQLSTFVQSKTGSYEADEGFNDDMVACGFLFAWLASQPWFKDLTDQDMRMQMYSQAEKDIEDDLPKGFGFADGTEEYASGNLSYDKEAMAVLL
jgi:hypothetical protein